MKTKCVLHVVQSLNFGGVESRMRTVALNSSYSSYKHSFCAISSGGAVANELIGAGKEVVIMNVRSRIPSLSAMLSLIQHVRSERPDVLHCHGAEANFHGLLSGHLCGIPVCLAEEIGVPNHSQKARFVFRHIYRLAKKVVAVSEPVKRELVKLGEVSEAKCEVLISPFQMVEQRNKTIPKSTFKVGYVGRLEEVKNPVGLVRAVALLRDRGLPIRLTIAGTGSEKNVLEREITTLGLQEHVEFLGLVSKPFEVMDDISLYVLPSFSEGLSNSLVEAMSAGIPVMATAVGGAPDVINHDVNGWLLSSSDPEAIANGIENCFGIEPYKLAEVGRRGRESVVERFSPKAYFTKCDEFYDRLLNDSCRSKG